MKVITNQTTTSNHLTAILNCLKVYDEVYIAVAFLKLSGLNQIWEDLNTFLKTGGQAIIIAGQNFGLTEPEALHKLRILFKTYPKSKLFLAKANQKTCVFHPKIYLFKTQKRCCIISGSANITQGGLVSNNEVSLLTNCKSNEVIWTETKNYFDLIANETHADEANILIIRQYETFFEAQKNHNKKAKPIPIKTKAQLSFDYNNLLRHYKKFNNSERQKIFIAKQNHYKEAKSILDEIADNPNLSQKLFEHYIDRLVGSKEENNLWHSGSLYRKRRQVYKYKNRFRALVKYIRENKNQEPQIVFRNALKFVDSIKGAGSNYVTEIMMTFNPKNFANLNRNPITVLKSEGGVNLKSHPPSYGGMDYGEYCELVTEICEKLGLRNMLEADSFFNEIYWNIKYPK